MIFSNLVPLGWLERCPTYKEQLRELSSRDLHTYGFLGYPVLQAADILLYKANIVPVGQDQLPHIELTNDIASKFNNLYGTIFHNVRPHLTKVSKLLGIDGRKMSKSYDNFIALGDSEDVIKNKCMKMFTDPERIKLSDKGHPDKCNLRSYYNIFEPAYASQVDEYCTKALVGCTECKKNLAKVICKYLADIRQKREKLLKNKDDILAILENGAEKARKVASKTMAEVKKAVGFNINVIQG
jgi:tryptophanyl-tRNA synthetase